MNCPNCGAAVKEGSFCNYCGAKLIADPRRVEIKIDQRIEDIAELKRAEYEEQESRIRQRRAIEEHEQKIAESKLRQKLMKKEIRQGNGCFLKCLIAFFALAGCSTILETPIVGIILFVITIVLVLISRR